MNDEPAELVGLASWLPTTETDFFGLNLSADYRKGWDEGRESFMGWYKKLTLWERIKIAFRGTLL